MNLTITGIDTGGTSKIIRLWVKGDYPKENGVIPLFLANNSNAYNSNLSLFIQGRGTSPGFIPYSEDINLFIKRGNNAGLPLYMENKNMGQSCPFYIVGIPGSQNTVPLYINGLGGDVTETVPLYIGGGDYTEFSSTVSLVMPQVVGFTPKSANLYIHGFQF